MIRVDGKNVLFANAMNGLAMLAPIEGLQLSKAGVIKEFPDLQDNTEWHSIAIKRFKEKIASMKTEQERMEYIVEDFQKYGYIPKFQQQTGHRTKMFKEQTPPPVKKEERPFDGVIHYGSNIIGSEKDKVKDMKNIKKDITEKDEWL